MAEISVLPPEIISRIAAGEVVERPASLIKELVENSVDAHATEIEIDLLEGGKKKVTVRDNGRGIAPDDLPLAFRSHATSKLRVEELRDGLFGISSLGFRGEALSSIAAVSDVEIVSRPPRAEHAYRYRPGRGDPEPAAAPCGTVVEVRDLFCKVPARRKFLRRDSTELSHILAQVTRLAFSFSSVRFLVTQKGKRVLDLPRASSLRERLEQVIGAEKARYLIEVSEGDGGEGPQLRGYVGSPRLRRRDTRDQHFFVNGRWVRDRLLTHAIRSAFQGFMIPGQQPVAWIFIELPAESVDVNVHPTKTEVRFRDSSSVYPLVFHAVRQALETSDSGGDGAARNDGPERGAEEATRPLPGAGEESSGRRVENAAIGFLFRRPEREVTARYRAPSGPGRRTAGPSPWRAGAERAPAGPSSRARGGEPVSAPPKRRVAPLQVLDTYLVLEDRDGILLIDQHALHEKILFEEIHRRLLGGSIVRQRLIVPEVLELDPEEVPLLAEVARLLEPCGFEVEPFGPRQAAIHSVPEVFSGCRVAGSPPSIVKEVLGWVAGGAPQWRAASPREAGGALSEPYRKLASMLACKRAVKAGTRLEPEELTALLDRADLALDPRHCPHGRPTAVRLERRDLEKLFDRK